MQVATSRSRPACRERAARAELVEGFGTGSVDTLPSQVGGQAARPPAYGVSGRGLRPTPFGVGTWEYILYLQIHYSSFGVTRGWCCVFLYFHTTVPFVMPKVLAKLWYM